MEIHRCVQKANVGRNKCQQRYAVWYSLIKSYFSDDHIPTFSSPKSRRPYSLERFRMHILASLLSNFSKQFKHLKHQPFLSSSNVQNSVSHSVRVNNFKPVLSKRFLSSSNLQNIVSNSARMLHFASLFWIFLSSSNFKNIVSNSVRMHHFTLQTLLHRSVL